MQSVQENDSLISVLMVLVVMKLWICADLDRSKADLWEGKEDVQLHTQQKASVPLWSSIVPSSLSHRSLCLLCRPQDSQRNLLENPQKVLIPEGAWNIL